MIYDNTIYLISILIVIAFTIYTILLTHQQKKKITCMNGMMISMTNSMMGSLTYGTIFGIIYQPNIATPTVISIILGMMIGYINGKPITLMASMDGLMAGIMGGMMGAMLGVMLQPTGAKLVITFITIIYTIMMALLIKMVSDETDSFQNKKGQKNLTITSIILTTAISFILVGIVLLGNNVFPNNRVSALFIEPEHKEGDICCPLDDNVEIVNGRQIAIITIDKNKISPEKFELKSSLPTTLKFVIDSANGDEINISSDDLNINGILKKGEKNSFDVGILKTGLVQYSCSICTKSGNIVVE
jgi:hypothetical protein